MKTKEKRAKQNDKIQKIHLQLFQTSQLCREVKSETGNCASHIDILGYKLMFRALYKTVIFSEFIYIALKHSFYLY